MVAVIMTAHFIILAGRINESLNGSHSKLLEAYLSECMTKKHSYKITPCFKGDSVVLFFVFFFSFLTLHSFQKPGPAEMGQKHTRFCNRKYYPIACWRMYACVHLKKEKKICVCMHIYFFNIHIYILC